MFEQRTPENNLDVQYEESQVDKTSNNNDRITIYSNNPFVMLDSN